MQNTRIPTASLDDQRADWVADAGEVRYRICEIATDEVLATGLKSREVVEYMWMRAGHDYELRPRMGVGKNCVESDAGTQHQLQAMFGLEWDVFFRQPAEERWEKSRMTAYGQTKREATVRLLGQAFEVAAWPDAADFAVTTHGEYTSSCTTKVSKIV